MVTCVAGCCFFAAKASGDIRVILSAAAFSSDLAEASELAGGDRGSTLIGRCWTVAET